MGQRIASSIRNSFRILVLCVCLLTTTSISTTLRLQDSSLKPSTASLSHNYSSEQLNPDSYPTDPTSDIPWSCGKSGVSDIQMAFNTARGIENTQLGLAIPTMTLPSQATWDVMSNNDRALWLINRERLDRSVNALHGTEANVISVAQNYANYLLVNNLWGHYADGHDPWWRLNNNPAIGACHDFLSVAENLYASMTSSSSIPLPIESAIYDWMYEDGVCCSWGHRHAILWYPYTENGGPSNMEGFLGIGRASGGPWQGWNFAEIIVMNVFDPCASWPYVVITWLPGIFLPIIRK